MLGGISVSCILGKFVKLMGLLQWVVVSSSISLNGPKTQVSDDEGSLGTLCNTSSPNVPHSVQWVCVLVVRSQSTQLSSSRMAISLSQVLKCQGLNTKAQQLPGCSILQVPTRSSNMEMSHFCGPQGLGELTYLRFLFFWLGCVPRVQIALIVD